MPTPRLTLLLPNIAQVSVSNLAGTLFGARRSRYFHSSLALALGIGLAGCAGNDGITPVSGGTSGFGTAGAGGLGGGVATHPGGSAGLGGSALFGGGSGGSGGSGGTGSGAIEPTFAMVKGVIKMSCFGGVCHDLPEHSFKLILDDKLYATLTTHMTKTCGPVVKPGSPQDSALVKLLKGPCGEIERMPLNKCSTDTDEACVRPEYIAAIEQWIANGAPQ